MLIIFGKIWGGDGLLKSNHQLIMLIKSLQLWINAYLVVKRLAHNLQSNKNEREAFALRIHGMREKWWRTERQFKNFLLSFQLISCYFDKTAYEENLKNIFDHQSAHTVKKFASEVRSQIIKVIISPGLEIRFPTKQSQSLLTRAIKFKCSLS